MHAVHASCRLCMHAGSLYVDTTISVDDMLRPLPIRRSSARPSALPGLCFRSTGRDGLGQVPDWSERCWRRRRRRKRRRRPPERPRLPSGGQCSCGTCWSNEKLFWIYIKVGSTAGIGFLNFPPIFVFPLPATSSIFPTVILSNSQLEALENS